jgi:hypothetical protein
VVVWSGELHTPPARLLHLERGKKIWILGRAAGLNSREKAEKKSLVREIVFQSNLI